MKIWEINLRRVMEEERMESAPIEIRFASIMDFLDRYWDQQDHMSPPSGRFIRNAVQSAMALAEFDQGRESDGNDPPRLTRHHIEAVLKSSNDFMEVIKIFLRFASASQFLVHFDKKATHKELR
jgi:hypothetical protein